MGKRGDLPLKCQLTLPTVPASTCFPPTMDLLNASRSIRPKPIKLRDGCTIAFCWQPEAGSYHSATTAAKTCCLPSPFDKDQMATRHGLIALFCQLSQGALLRCSRGHALLPSPRLLPQYEDPRVSSRSPGDHPYNNPTVTVSTCFILLGYMDLSKSCSSGAEHHSGLLLSTATEQPICILGSSFATCQLAVASLVCICMHLYSLRWCYSVCSSL